MRSSSGKFIEKVFHLFAGGLDGVGANYLTVSDGNIYGSTLVGGGASGCGSAKFGCGTIFRVSSSGAYSVVYRFKSYADGQYPESLYALGGMLYGLTERGGAYQCGTFFSLTPAGEKRTLYSFKGNTDGCAPTGALTYTGGQFLGVTLGSSGPYEPTGFLGTVFAVSVAGKETVLHRFHVATGGGLPQYGLTILGNELFGTTFVGDANACHTDGGQKTGCGLVFEITVSRGSPTLF